MDSRTRRGGITGQQWSGNSKRDRAGYRTGRDSEGRAEMLGGTELPEKGMAHVPGGKGAGGRERQV